MSSRRSRKPSGPEFIRTPGMVYDPSPQPDGQVVEITVIEPGPRDLVPREVIIQMQAGVTIPNT